MPTPIPVYVIPPDPWSWAWWLQNVVPVIGAAGSILITLFAVWVTIRLASLDRRVTERDERKRFAERLFALVEDAVRLHQSTFDERRVLDRGGRVETLQIDARSTATDGGILLSWILHEISMATFKPASVKFRGWSDSNLGNVDVVGIPAFGVMARREIRHWLVKGTVSKRVRNEQRPLQGPGGEAVW